MNTVHVKHAVIAIVSAGQEMPVTISNYRGRINSAAAGARNDLPTHCSIGLNREVVRVVAGVAVAVIKFAD